MNTKVIYNRTVALTVTLILVTTFALGGNIQKRTIKRIAPQRTITGEEIFSESPNQRIGYPSTYTISPGDSIDRTTYDLGTNASANHNLLNFGTTVSLARMVAHDLSAGTLDRDSWVSCSTNGGVSWPALTKVEVLRRGWTNIFNNNGISGTVTHQALEVNTDAANCMHTWTSHIGTGPAYVWPRVTTTGTTNVHVIVANANPPTSLLYLRSTDNGATFSYPGVAIPGTYVMNADIYDIASFGTNLAVVICQVTGDVLLAQSTNEGLTWSTSTIYNIDETFMTAEDVPDGTCAAVYDNTGALHVVWANYFASGGGPDSIFYSVGTGIHHWSLATGDQLIALPPSDAGVPDTSRNGAIANQPDIAVDANNNLYVVFQSWISELDALGYNQEHVFGVASSDAGATWDPVVDLTPGTGFSASYPAIPDNVGTDNIVHLVYNSDPYSGSYIYDVLLAPTIPHPHINVAVKHYGILKGNFFTLDCADISSMAARCVGGGTKTVQARVNLLNSTVFVGRTVTVTIDEDSYVGTIITNGTHSRANFSISGVYTTGDHVVTLVSPACLTPKHATCATSDGIAKVDPDWGEDWGNLDKEQSQVSADVPTKTTLLGNYPNPFNPSTTISYGITTDARVSLKIYNTLGEEVATLVNEFQSAGFKSAVWDGKNSAGSPVASGIYIYRLTAGNVVKTQKMMFMK